MRRIVLAPLAALALVGCIHTYESPYMHPQVPSRSIAAPPGQALVVFVRPSSYAPASGATILDEQGRFVGDSAAASHFAVAVPPGRHLFAVWAENTDAIEIDAAPGRTYFVEVGATIGVFSAQMHLYAIAPNGKQWPRRQAWLLSTTQLRPDAAAGDQYLAGRAGDVQERMRRARERIARYRAESRAEHFLAADDGV